MVNGIINVHKEAGFTSHDVVARLRGIFRQKKIGHTGTLDPGATGVLPVCLGKATRLCDMIGDWDKTYQAVLLLGRTTDTEDVSGKVLSSHPVEVDEEEVRRILLSFIGDYDQVPPMYSAKKTKGRRLYELAREGIVVERPPCRVQIYSLEIMEICLPRVRFQVTCSKGTYIRSLCRDIGDLAGCGGCMEELVRTRVENFRIDESHTLDEIAGMVEEGREKEILYPIDSLFQSYPARTVDKKGDRLLMNGNEIPCSMTIPLKADPDPGKKSDHDEVSFNLLRLYDKEGHFIGLYTVRKEEKRLKPYKMFFDIQDKT